MRRARLYLAVLALVGFFAAPSAQSQGLSVPDFSVQGPADVEPVTIAPDALPDVTVKTVLKKGLQLESNERWGEALSHYEDALRTNGDNTALRKRHDLAKLHYSLGRRYHDRSFKRSVAALNRQQALSLYSEDEYSLCELPFLAIARRTWHDGAGHRLDR